MVTDLDILYPQPSDDNRVVIRIDEFMQRVLRPQGCTWLIDQVSREVGGRIKPFIFVQRRGETMAAFLARLEVEKDFKVTALPADLSLSSKPKCPYCKGKSKEAGHRGRHTVAK